MNEKCSRNTRNFSKMKKKLKKGANEEGAAAMGVSEAYTGVKSFIAQHSDASERVFLFVLPTVRQPVIDPRPSLRCLLKPRRPSRRRRRKLEESASAINGMQNTSGNSTTTTKNAALSESLHSK